MTLQVVAEQVDETLFVFFVGEEIIIAAIKLHKRFKESDCSHISSCSTLLSSWDHVDIHQIPQSVACNASQRNIHNAGKFHRR